MSALDNTVGWIKGAAEKISKISASDKKWIEQKMADIPVATLLGLNNGVFDSKDGRTLGQKSIANYYRQYLDNSVGALIGAGFMYGGKTVEGATMYKDASEAAAGSRSMMSRVDDQMNILSNPNANVTEKALARLGMSRSFGKVEDIYTGMQQMSPYLANIISTYVGADTYATTATSSAMNPIAQLIGMEAQRGAPAGSVYDGTGGGSAQTADIIKWAAQAATQNNMAIAAFGEALKNNKNVNKDVLDMLTESYKETVYRSKQMYDYINTAAGGRNRDAQGNVTGYFEPRPEEQQPSTGVSYPVKK